MDKSVQNKLHKYMTKKFILGNGYLNNLKQFWQIWPWWQWPLATRSIGFLCCRGWMCGPSLRKLGEGVFELLIGSEKVTDRQTTRSPCAKQYALSSSNGGIKTCIHTHFFSQVEACLFWLNIRVLTMTKCFYLLHIVDRTD